jgi:hypothetical protein
MTLPTIVFGFISAILIGSGFHLWKGGGLGKLMLYLVASIIGFWLGQFFAILLQWQFLPVGALQFGIDVLGSGLSLFVGYWLTNHKAVPKR